MPFLSFGILIFNPFQIADVGFQLSYLAVIGIVSFQNKIYSVVFIRNSILDKTWKLVSVSIAAQLTTTPLTILYFHQFPVYFWITNVFAIPLTALITYSGAILAFFITCKPSDI
ncbi:MAG: hypothetical protein HC906_16955 [Bacteroidales bacterium]|nr:hypothetical protein [Bacteroidales bacterium]